MCRHGAVGNSRKSPPLMGRAHQVGLRATVAPTRPSACLLKHIRDG